MNSIWQYWMAGINQDLVNNIVSAGEQYPIEPAKLGFEGGTSNDNNYRTSENRWIDVQNPSNRFITDMLWYFAHEANKNAFGFDITYIPDLQYTKYYAADNGHYDWHIDTFWGNPTTFDRKLSIVVQLSDPLEYDGGDFQFDPEYPQPDQDQIRQQGTIIVFPSFIRHRVTPVTRGERKSLVSWIQGPKFR